MATYFITHRFSYQDDWGNNQNIALASRRLDFDHGHCNNGAVYFMAFNKAAFS
jgi:hypothetical protein